MSFYARYGNVSIPGMNTRIASRTAIAPPTSDIVPASVDLANKLKAISLVSAGATDPDGGYTSVRYKADAPPAALPPPTGQTMFPDGQGGSMLDKGAFNPIDDRGYPIGQSKSAATANPAQSSMVLIIAAAVLIPVVVIGVVMMSRKRPALAGYRRKRKSRRSRR